MFILILILPHPILSYSILSNPIIRSYHDPVIFCQFPSFPVLSCPVLSCPVLSYPTILYEPNRILSYPIHNPVLPYPILSRFVCLFYIKTRVDICLICRSKHENLQSVNIKPPTRCHHPPKGDPKGGSGKYTTFEWRLSDLSIGSPFFRIPPLNKPLYNYVYITLNKILYNYVYTFIIYTLMLT